jgi:hypothetical protein
MLKNYHSVADVHIIHMTYPLAAQNIHTTMPKNIGYDDEEDPPPWMVKRLSWVSAMMISLKC